MKAIGITGKVAQTVLDEIGITANRNTIPFETLSPFVTSGIRLGSPALTTRGFKEDDFKEVADIISTVVKNPEDAAVKADCEKACPCSLREVSALRRSVMNTSNKSQSARAGFFMLVHEYFFRLNNS